MSLLDRFTIRRRFFTFLGQKLDITGANGEPLFYTRLKPFKLREEITLFTGQNLDDPAMEIRGRKIIDISGVYDVTDLGTGEHVGSLQRMGLRSILRDRWKVFNPAGTEVAMIQEDSMLLAAIRRVLASFIPQSFTITSDGRPIGELRQRLHLFVLTMDADFTTDAEGTFDRRLGLAAAVLLAAIEGRQSNG